MMGVAGAARRTGSIKRKATQERECGTERRPGRISTLGLAVKDSGNDWQVRLRFEPAVRGVFLRRSTLVRRPVLQSERPAGAMSFVEMLHRQGGPVWMSSGSRCRMA